MYTVDGSRCHILGQSTSGARKVGALGRGC